MILLPQQQMLSQQQAALMTAAAQAGTATYINPNLALGAQLPHAALAAVPNGLSTASITPTTTGRHSFFRKSLHFTILNLRYLYLWHSCHLIVFCHF